MKVAVLTLDQQRSRTRRDAVPELLAALTGPGLSGEPLRPFQRTVGDEVQGVVDDPELGVEAVGRLIRDVRAVSPVPVAVGFGVSKPGHARAIAKAGADGVIVASALVDALGPDGRDVAALRRLVLDLRAATATKRSDAAAARR